MSRGLSVLCRKDQCVSNGTQCILCLPGFDANKKLSLVHRRTSREDEDGSVHALRTRVTCSLAFGVPSILITVWNASGLSMGQSCWWAF